MANYVSLACAKNTTQEDVTLQMLHSSHAPLISLRKIVDGTYQSTIEGNVNLSFRWLFNDKGASKSCRLFDFLERAYCGMSRSPVTHTLHWLLLVRLWFEQVIMFVGQTSQAYMCITLTFTRPLARLIPLLIWKMSFFILIQPTHSDQIGFFYFTLFWKGESFWNSKGPISSLCTL